MHFAVEVQLLQCIPSVGLEGCAEVVNVDAADFRGNPVGDSGGYFSHNEVVDAFFSPAAVDVEALV